jgi:hypothetical protein
MLLLQKYHIAQRPWPVDRIAGTIHIVYPNHGATPTLLLNRSRVFKFFKYTVYVLLIVNVYLFFAEEWAASPHRFVNGIGLADVTEAFAASIDTAAWVGLLLLFELETYVLDDRHFTRRVTWTLHGLRGLCFLGIVYVFFDGYIGKLIFLLAATPLAGVVDLCTLVDGSWAYAIDLDEYAILTAASCAAISPSNTFMQLPGLAAVVDQAGLTDIVRLAWIDVINAGVWLLVVLVLEVDVRLQERGKLVGNALRTSNLSKYVLYSILVLALIYWTFKGDFVDFWDALLWLVAFVFIELNVFDWRQESEAQHDLVPGAPG